MRFLPSFREVTKEVDGIASCQPPDSFFQAVTILATFFSFDEAEAQANSVVVLPLEYNWRTRASRA
jgi:hypothetical protein